MIGLLFSPYTLGALELPNRVVMAPMTRSRAEGNVPNALMAEYYAQRAEAALIITEGTAPCPNGLGYPRIPSLYSDAQVAGWRKVTAAVKARGGRMYAQLMHVGRVAHPLNLPTGAEIVAPSALAAPANMITDQEGPRPHPVPRAMTDEDIRQAIEEHVHSAQRAIEAGFDGVEIHGANGYLVEQFLNPVTNQRTDAYGAASRTGIDSPSRWPRRSRRPSDPIARGSGSRPTASSTALGCTTSSTRSTSRSPRRSTGSVSCTSRWSTIR